MCEYCEHGELVPWRYADGFEGWIEVYIEHGELIVTIGSDELAIPVNACPMCGRDLRGDA